MGTTEEKVWDGLRDADTAAHDSDTPQFEDRHRTNLKWHAMYLVARSIAVALVNIADAIREGRGNAN